MERMRYVTFGASGLNEREIKPVHKEDKAKEIGQPKEEQIKSIKNVIEKPNQK